MASVQLIGDVTLLVLCSTARHKTGSGPGRDEHVIDGALDQLCDTRRASCCRLLDQDVCVTLTPAARCDRVGAAWMSGG